LIDSGPAGVVNYAGEDSREVIVQFEVLGHLAIRVGGHEVRLESAVGRVLIARLLIDANQGVTTDQLIAAVGGDDRARLTGPALRAHIGHLRRALGADRLLTVPGGYQLTVRGDELDTSAFESDVRAGCAALVAGDLAVAADDLERALGRWRGPAWTVASGAGWAAIEAARLDVERQVAEENLLDAWLALRRYPEVIEMCEGLLAAQPGREVVCACLMLGLHCSGQKSDAVRVYQRLRTALEVDGGRAPSAELVQLERSILHGDPALVHARRPRVLTPVANAGRSSSGRALPGGVVTFLMTDVVGSTRLWETAPQSMRLALARHDEIMALAAESHDGVLLRERGEGDSTFSVFRRVTDAAAAALAAQLAFASEPWALDCIIRVRMAMHAGEASERDGDYYGRPVNRVARIRSIAEGGQILVGQSAAEILFDHLPAGVVLVAVGVNELPGLDRPETVYMLDGSAAAPPLASLEKSPQGASAPSAPTSSEPVEKSHDSATPPSTGSEVWEAVVDTDRAYYDEVEETDTARPPFPLGSGRRVVTLTSTAVLIGRGGDSVGTGLRLHLTPSFLDPGVSRLHAVLERRPDGSYSLLDPGSLNGTFLNTMDHPIPRRVLMPLKAGDFVYLGFWTRIEIATR
jgi:class 3 adenylate cyclase